MLFCAALAAAPITLTIAGFEGGMFGWTTTGLVSSTPSLVKNFGENGSWTVTPARIGWRRTVHELLQQKVIQGRHSFRAPLDRFQSRRWTPDLRERVRQIKEGERARRPASIDAGTLTLPGID